MQKLWNKRIWCRNRQKGFSLAELMVVIAIIGIIAGFATPAYLNMREKYSLRSSATDVMSNLKRARSEAVRSGANVVFTRAATTCTVLVDNGTGTGGVANDSTRNGDEPEYVITILPGNAFGAGSLASTVFNSRGFPTTTGNIFVTKTSDSTLQYRIALNSTGHVNLQVSTNGGATWN